MPVDITPTVSDVAAIVPSASSRSCPSCQNIRQSCRSIVIYDRRQPDSTTTISEMHDAYDPLHYALMFPYGTRGWRRQGIPQQITVEQQSNENKKHKDVSMRQFYAWHLQIQEHLEFLHRHGRLFQEYLTDMFAKIDQDRLNYHLSSQMRLRQEVFSGLVDSFHEGDHDVARIGRRVIQPQSYTGGPRDMHNRYQNAMVFVREFGKPDLFITITCNPE